MGRSATEREKKTKYKVHTLVIDLGMNSSRKSTRHASAMVQTCHVGGLQYMDKKVRMAHTHSNALI